VAGTSEKKIRLLESSSINGGFAGEPCLITERRMKILSEQTVRFIEILSLWIVLVMVGGILPKPVYVTK
jgi:hypothetical protein